MSDGKQDGTGSPDPVDRTNDTPDPARPDPEATREPRTPPLRRPRSWAFVLGSTLRQFTRDQCLDLAAALTYYAVLAATPALLAVVSLLGFVGDSEEIVEDVLDIAESVVPEDAMTVLRPMVEQVTGGGRAGLALVLGLVLALWSASGYVGAFGRAMNRVYEIDEGRPAWKLRPVMLLITLVVVLLAALVTVALVLSGSLARAVGETIGVGAGAVTVWNLVKWPVVLLLVVVLVAVLYHFTPNVRRPRFRWLSVGALVAILGWVVASAGFGVYIARFGSYDATYGTLGGIIVVLLWMWITNLALLFGAELDAEIERGRELRSGIAAEERIQLPARDTRASEKKERKHRDDVARGRSIREDAGATDPGPERRSST